MNRRIYIGLTESKGKKVIQVAGPRSVALKFATTLTALAAIIATGFGQATPGTVVSIGGPSLPAGLTNVVAVAAGDHRGAALHDDGKVTAWSTAPVLQVFTVSNVASISVGGMDTGYAVLSNGTVVPLTPQDRVPPAGLSNVVAVEAGELGSAYAVKSDGTVVGWGLGGPPAPPSDLTNAVAVAMGQLRYIALRSDGTIATWALANPFNISSVSNAIAIAAGLSNFFALSSSGTVIDLTTNQIGGVPPGLSNVAALSTGWGHTLAWKQDGSLIGWGNPATPAGLTNITAFSAGKGFSLVVSTWPVITVPPQSTNVNGGATASFNVTAQGAGPFTYQWQKGGSNIDGATATNLVIPNAQSSDAADYTVVVNNSVGAVTSAPATLTVNTGPVITGQLNSYVLFIGAKFVVSPVVTGSLPVSFQWLHDSTNVPGQTNSTLSIDIQSSDTGTFTLVASNSFGSVSSNLAIVSLASRTVAYPPPGTVISLGGPILPPDLTNVVAIAAGSGRAAALRSDGTVTAWGGPPGIIHYAAISNAVAVAVGNLNMGYALLSNGTVVRLAPNNDALPPDNLFGVVAIASGEFNTLALKADGTIVGWGPGNPTPPASISNVAAISAGQLQFLALRNDGTVATWGIAPVGLVPASNVVAVAAGRTNNFAIHGDGTVLDLSTNANGGVPAGLSNVVALSTGYGHTLALKQDGSVVGWGNATIPSDLTNIAAVAAGNGFSLLLSTNPPPPMLGGVASEGTLKLSTPVAVSGYVFEATDDLSQPYQIINIFTNAIDLTDTNNPAFAVPMSGAKKYFRLRKIQE